jgi:hypothetical protein
VRRDCNHEHIERRYQYKNLFARGELSWVGASDVTPGAAFGTDGNRGHQVRGLIELGVLF